MNTPDKEEYTSHGALKEWEAEKDQNTITQNIVALLGIHGMHCKFYEFQNASHITKAFESLFIQYHQDLMREVVGEIEKAKYPKNSTQGCKCNGYNNALTQAQTIIKSK